MSAITYYPCPDCGGLCKTPQGLSAHKGKKPCEVAATYRNMTARNYIRAYPWQHRLSHTGVLLTAPVRWQAGSGGQYQRRRSRIYYGPWAPEWAVLTAQSMAEYGATVAETRQEIRKVAALKGERYTV